MAVTNSSPDRHVAVLAFPFTSHPSLLLGLVTRLATAAPSVTFSFFSTAKSNKTLLAKPILNNIKAYDVWDGVPEGYMFEGRPQEDIELFLKAAPEELKKVVKAAEADIGRRVTCIMADAFLWFSVEIAEEFGIPWVPFWSSGPPSLSVHVYTDLIRNSIRLHSIVGQEDEILKFVPGFSKLRLGDLPSGVVSGNLKSPFSILLHKMGQSLHRAAAVPINCYEELEPEVTKDLKAKFSKYLNIGPLNLKSQQPESSKLDEHGCIPWLDKQEKASVAYIGFGTAATPLPNELVALAEALEESGTPFIWSLKEHSKIHLPQGFLKYASEYGKIVPWAPQVQVLAHSAVGAFITHCGWNSVLESIAAGVPIIGRPFFGEQQLNTWMIEVWKIGVRIEGGVFTKNGTLVALNQVLKDEKGKKLKEQIEVYKELAFKALGPKGSSTENFQTLLEVITSNNL